MGKGNVPQDGFQKLRVSLFVVTFYPLHRMMETHYVQYKGLGFFGISFLNSVLFQNCQRSFSIGPPESIRLFTHADTFPIK